MLAFILKVCMTMRLCPTSSIKDQMSFGKLGIGNLEKIPIRRLIFLDIEYIESSFIHNTLSERNAITRKTKNKNVWALAIPFKVWSRILLAIILCSRVLGLIDVLVEQPRNKVFGVLRWE